MKQPCILIVEADVLVRNPLAEYLRECGYQVQEAFNPTEARQLLGKGSKRIDIVLADVDDVRGENGFALARWIRTHHPSIEVILAGTISMAAAKAGELCEEGPKLSKPYDHRMIADHVRRLQAARDRGAPTE